MKVGIIIIFYNNEKDIDISLLSEQLNNCINIDFCFINNSSNDGTYHVLSEIKQVSKSNISIVDIKKHVSEQLAIKAGVRYMSNYFQINHFGFLNMEALRNDSKKIQEIIIDVNNNRDVMISHSLKKIENIKIKHPFYNSIFSVLEYLILLKLHIKSSITSFNNLIL